MDSDKVQKVYVAAEEIVGQDFTYLTVTDAYHEFPRSNNGKGQFPDYEVYVTVEDSENVGEGTTYTYPVAEYMRENHDLFLFDTVTFWEEQKVKMRFGLKEE